MATEEADQYTLEARLEGALESRLQHFRENASSLSLVGIRRLLEEDLGLEKNALDVHKKFVKQFIDKNLHADNDVEAIESKNTEEKAASEDRDLSEPISSGEAKPDQESPIKGVLKAENQKVSCREGTRINESMLKKAIQERKEYFISQSRTLTMAGARRYLEEDLGLVEFALDPFKKFVRQEIEKVIDSSVVSTSVTVSHSTNAASENDDEDQEEKPRKKSIPRDRAENVEREKKRKRIEKRNDVSNKKHNKPAKKQLEEDSEGDNDNGSSTSDDDEPKSTAEKHAKKKEAPSSAYGKQVDHLKSVIKACGMGIAPTLYKKAKMVPDSKREAFLLKELEGLLLKEGLSKNPSEKEIKEVRKKKERAKELEGIDTSNIISSSRSRRSTMSLTPPPRPKKNEDSGDDVMSTRMAKDDGKYAGKEEDDGKQAKKTEGDDLNSAKKIDEDDVGEEGDEENDGGEDEDDEDASENEEFNDDDEGSD